MSRDWQLFLDDIVERAEKIGRLLHGHTFESFCADESAFDAVDKPDWPLVDGMEDFPESEDSGGTATTTAPDEGGE